MGARHIRGYKSGFGASWGVQPAKGLQWSSFVLCCMYTYTPMRNTASHDNQVKINPWVSLAFLYGYGATLGGPLVRRSYTRNASSHLPGETVLLSYEYYLICFNVCKQHYFSADKTCISFKTIEVFYPR